MELKVVGAKAEPTGRWAETEKVSKFKSFDENLWRGSHDSSVVETGSGSGCVLDWGKFSPDTG